MLCFRSRLSKPKNGSVGCRRSKQDTDLQSKSGSARRSKFHGDASFGEGHPSLVVAVEGLGCTKNLIVALALRWTATEFP